MNAKLNIMEQSQKKMEINMSKEVKDLDKFKSESLKMLEERLRDTHEEYVEMHSRLNKQ